MGHSKKVLCLLALGLAVALAGCSSSGKPTKSSKLDPFAGTGSPYYKGNGKIPFAGGRYHVGKPYQVAGRWFTPREQPGYDKSGVASWYGEAFHRRMTSNGEYFDMNTLTAAHATLPIPSYAKVTNLSNGKSVVVRINDRGPFVDTRVIDLSKKTAEVLNFKNQGKAKVRVQWIGPAPLKDSGKHLAMMNQQARNGATIRKLIAASEGPVRGNVAVAKAEPVDAGVETAAYEPDVAPAPVKKKLRSAGYVVNVATFQNPENAEAARDSLISVGPTKLFEIDGDEGVAYRVLLGPFTDSYEAQEALNAAREAGFEDARLSKTRIEQVSSR